jgi:hypothetical protein
MNPIVNDFTMSVEESLGVYLWGSYGGSFTMSKHVLTASQITMSTRSWGHYNHSQFTIISVLN